MSKNTNIESLVEQYGDNKPWNWDLLSLNKSITPEFVLKNIHLPWNYSDLLTNLNITSEYTERYIQTLSDLRHIKIRIKELDSPYFEEQQKYL